MASTSGCSKGGRFRIPSPSALATALVVSMLGPFLTPAGAEEGVRHGVPATEQKASKDFWTPTRIREAVGNGSPRGDARSSTWYPTLRHFPVPYEWSDPAIGKLVFRWRGGSYSCSGSVIDTWSQRLVLTAGHCLAEGRRWSRYVRFIPAYEFGRRPYGTWAPRNLWVPSAWFERDNRNFDLGLLVMKSRIGDSTGSLDYEVFPERVGSTRIFGYPGGSMRGEQQRACSSRTWGAEVGNRSKPGPLGMGAWCNMAGGSSGGPWLSAYGSGSYTNWKLDGLTSTGTGGRSFSPYLGRAFTRLIGAAQDW